MKREQKNGEGTKMRPSENQTHKIKEEITCNNKRKQKNKKHTLVVAEKN